ncbi:hypothetical protein EV361DRAFT_417559 [Lentinula raphanica]|nr:hypothetical protein EV361DRAFT_417559 [Lentinula raphanica]
MFVRRCAGDAREEKSHGHSRMHYYRFLNLPEVFNETARNKRCWEGCWWKSESRSGAQQESASKTFTLTTTTYRPPTKHSESLHSFCIFPSSNSLRTTITLLQTWFNARLLPNLYFQVPLPRNCGLPQGCNVLLECRRNIVQSLIRLSTSSRYTLLSPPLSQTGLRQPKCLFHRRNPAVRRIFYATICFQVRWKKNTRVLGIRPEVALCVLLGAALYHKVLDYGLYPSQMAHSVCLLVFSFNFPDLGLPLYLTTVV